MLRTLTPNVRGMAAMTMATILFTFSDMFAKLATQHWPVWQFLVVRSILAIIVLLVMARALGEGDRIDALRQPKVIIRSLIEASLAVVFIKALSLMPLADLTTIIMLAPLVITAFANLFLGEVVGWRRWTAIAVGSAGLLLVVQPASRSASQDAYLYGVALGLLSVVAVAGRDIITRTMPAAVPSTIVALGTSIATLTAGLALAGLQPWTPVEPAPLVFTALAALIVSAGNLLLVISCRGVDLSAVAPFRYSGVLWSILAGYLVFGDRPNLTALAGMAVIVASGVYLMHRERVRAKERVERAGKVSGP